MSPALQTKLLRVLQEKEFEPLGSARTIKVDIRVIAATNKDLTKEVKEGRFREDLYYRLNVVPITMPPLRERKEDIPPLADHFLAVYREKNRKPLKGISGKALDLLVRYDWPGNIRELENCIERAVIMAREEMIIRRRFSPPDPEALRGRGKGGFRHSLRDEPRGDGEGTDRQNARRDRRQPHQGRGNPRHQPPHPAEQIEGVRPQYSFFDG